MNIKVMLINERNMKKRPVKPSYLLYTTTINEVKKYTTLSTEEYINIINNNNINNIEKILVKKLESVSVSNIFRLIDYTNLLKMDLENKIKNNKNNNIFIGLSFIVIVCFSLLAIATYYYDTTSIQKYVSVINQNISLNNNQISNNYTVRRKPRSHNLTKVNQYTSIIINKNSTIINHDASSIINQNSTIINQNASVINSDALIVIQKHFFNKIIIQIVLFLISVGLLFTINNIYPPIFIQKNKLNKLHKTTKILQKIIDISY